MTDKVHVLMTTEGTFPFYQGGVSTWCDMILQRLKDVEFTVVSVTADPFVTQKFALPNDATLVRVPLWGTEDPQEFSDTPFSSAYIGKLRTTERVIEEEFLPIFTGFIQEIFSLEKDSKRFAQSLITLYHYFADYDYKLSFKSELTWNAYRNCVLSITSDPDHSWDVPDVYCLIQSLGWIYRFFQILNIAVPKTHVSHSSAAAFCGIPCIIAKLVHGTPYLLTEHGVYLREQYISLAKRGYPSFLNTFLIRLIRSVVDVNYALADQISPVCEYNVRWERQFVDDIDKIEVIHNGVNARVFAKDAPPVTQPMTIVSIARIDPIKDIFTLLHAAKYVKKQFQDVQFQVFGSVSVPEYYEQCLELRSSLGLETCFHFAGHTSNVIAAYQCGDIVVQSSVSEAFPYSIIEAMMAAKAIVSTDVGGVPEALGDTGLLVSPNDPQGLAQAIIRLIADTELRATLGQEARERALSQFTMERALGKYMKTYIQFAVRAQNAATAPTAILHTTNVAVQNDRRHSQRLYVEQGMALMDNGYFQEAIDHFRRALSIAPPAVANPVIVAETCKAYKKMGRTELARNEWHKFILLERLSRHNAI